MTARRDPKPAHQPREFWVIAYLVLTSFLAIMIAILVGCGLLLSGRIGLENAPALAAVSGLVGAIAGYAAANTQTVLSTIYGGGSVPNEHPPRTVNDASTTINGNVEPKDTK